MSDGIPLDYDFDEETLGFGEPASAPPTPPLSGSERFALALVGLGLLATIVLSFGGPLAGTWLGFALSLGLLALGGALYFRVTYAGTTPGIKHDGVFFNGLMSRGGLGWTAGILMTGFYVLIYWFPGLLGHHPQGEPTGMVRLVDPVSRLMSGSPASQWFLYGVLYSLAIAVFAVRTWMKYRHNRYQQVRTLSVVFFQLVFAFALPNVLVLFQLPYYELNGVWPLKWDYLWPSKIETLRSTPGAFGSFLIFWGLAAAFVATPVLTYYFGKRWYCSWVCGCGGLAETLGDPFRQLSDKSTRAWKIERWLIHSILGLILVTTALVWFLPTESGFAGGLRWFYGFFVGAIFSGIVGVGFYPLLGNRVWCRFGCPQAAILGIFQKLFSRFRITTNGEQCMSCGNCSTYCEMGIDVRAYAQQSENIVRASCVGCGVCAAVCPRGVLKLENGSTHTDR